VDGLDQYIFTYTFKSLMWERKKELDDDLLSTKQQNYVNLAKANITKPVTGTFRAFRVLAVGGSEGRDG
jgi:hypothetical protein